MDDIFLSNEKKSAVGDAVVIGGRKDEPIFATDGLYHIFGLRDMEAKFFEYFEECGRVDTTACYFEHR